MTETEARDEHVRRTLEGIVRNQHDKGVKCPVCKKRFHDSCNCCPHCGWKKKKQQRIDN